LNANLLIVDDEEMIRELLCSALSREGWCCHQACNADEGRFILQNQKIDLALLDIMMPGYSGIDLLQELKKICPDTSALMVTAMSDMDTALSCMHMGADDYIVKPFNIDRIVITVNNSLEKRRLFLENKEYQRNLEIKVYEQTGQIRAAMEEIQLSYEHTLTALVRALDAREKEIGSHSERVMNYTLLLAKAWGVAEPELSHMAKGTLLHDIGKIGVADCILLKEGALSKEEWDEMRRHPLVGYEILSGIKALKGAAEFVLSHHERYDGAGYPCGLKGEEIPLSARIFALADTLDAMTSDRPYRRALPFQAVVKEVDSCCGTQFDPEIVKFFLKIPKAEWEEAAGKKFL
jgi:response regulator RpfG family c-di-GMP phosphodiesterase